MSLTTSAVPASTDEKILDLTTGDVLVQAARDCGERRALIALAPQAQPRTWTYAELLEDARRAAHWLLGRFTPGDRIVVWAPNDPEWVILQYGAAMAGLVLVTANPALRAGELEYILRQSEAVGIAYSDEFRGTDMAAIAEEVRARVPAVQQVVRFRDWYEQLQAVTDVDRELPHVDPGSAAQLQYTSGTTGFPKGALLHHRGLVTNAHYVHRRAQFPRHGTWVTPLPLFHTAGCGLSVLGNAISRGTLVLCRQFDPKLVLNALQDWKADVYAGVPAMYVGLLSYPEFSSYDLSSVTVTMSGGDAVPPELIAQVEEKFGARFSTVYGQTELSPIVTQTSPDDPDEQRRNTVGRPLWNVELKIVDPSDGSTVPVGTEGEICARGYQTMLGYFQMPEETRKTIDADGWLHTGDLGVLDENGYLRVTGRIKDMIIRGGENIYPREIEAVLATHPQVGTAIVVGLPDEQWGEVVAAAIQPKDERAVPTKDELHAFVRERLAPAKTPKHWYLASQLPTNAMGKLQKFRVRDQILDGQLTALE